MPAHRQATQRNAMVALPTRNEIDALRATRLHKELPRELHRRLSSLAARAHNIRHGHGAAGAGAQLRGQRLRDGGPEEQAVHVLGGAQLRGDRRLHARVAVAQARHRCAARRVQDPLPRRQRQPQATRGGDGGREVVQRPVQHVGVRVRGGALRFGGGCREHGGGAVGVRLVVLWAFATYGLCN